VTLFEASDAWAGSSTPNGSGGYTIEHAPRFRPRESSGSEALRGKTSGSTAISGASSFTRIRSR
jgi:hypothetical protein